KLVESEIEVLKSRNLVLQVVNDLQLWTNYQEKQGLSKRDLYDTSPVRLHLFGPAGEINKQVLEIVINDENSFLLNDDDGEFKQFYFKRRYESNFGGWEIEP